MQMTKELTVFKFKDKSIRILPDDQLPGFLNSILTCLLPVGILLVTTIFQLGENGNRCKQKNKGYEKWLHTIC